VLEETIAKIAAKQAIDARRRSQRAESAPGNPTIGFEAGPIDGIRLDE